jgi:hypothetical protein
LVTSVKSWIIVYNWIQHTSAFLSVELERDVITWTRRGSWKINVASSRYKTKMTCVVPGPSLLVLCSIVHNLENESNHLQFDRESFDNNGIRCCKRVLRHRNGQS